MHELEFDHGHVDPEERQAIADAIWASDNVELTTVGIDIGSSTSHLMFARVRMQRLASALSSRFVVIGREIIWRSPILLTPYRADYTIDADRLAGFIEAAYRSASIAREAVDSGAVILTGEALKRQNARAIADLFSAEAGKFVCASAGHHMECVMAAHGSGAVRMSRERGLTLLNVDIGGGTTKFALIARGEVVASAAIAVGGRLLVSDAEGRLTRLEEPMVRLAESLGIRLRLGAILALAERAQIVARMVSLVLDMVARRPPDALAKQLLVTDGWEEPALHLPLDAITFSGGVAEYLYGREKGDFGDLGADLAHELRHELAHHRVAATVWDPGQGIRATVIGAAQFSVQVSGNTILIVHPERLPLRNLPVLACRFDLAETVEPAAIAATVRRALVAADLEEGGASVALAFAWLGTPDHARLSAVARGIADALPKTIAAGLPIVLLIDGDVGKTIGRILHHETAPGSDVIAIDGVQLKELDYVDIGAVIQPTAVVPVIIKSLLF